MQDTTKSHATYDVLYAMEINLNLILMIITLAEVDQALKGYP